MKSQISLKEMSGRTVGDFEYSHLTNSLVITFTDNTYIHLGILTGYEVGDEEIEDRDIDLLFFGDKELIKLGIISKKELENHRQISEEESNRQHEIYERQMLLRLKTKYEE